MKKISKALLQGIVIMGAMNILYLLFMVLAFSIPKEKMMTNMGLALEVWQYEAGDDLVQPLFRDKGFYLDSFSDMIWANTASQTVDNPLQMAVAMEYSYPSGGAV